MRVLGVLRHWLKLTLVFFSIFMTLELNAAEVIKGKEQLLKKAFEQSAEFQKISAQLDVETIDAESLLALYNWNLSGGVSRVDSERPITNPFSPNNQLTTSYNLRLQKDNASGINPFVEMRAEDAGLSFPDGRSINFQTASVEAGLRVDLMKAIFLRSSVQAFSEASTKKEIAKLSKQSAEQTFAIRVSKAYYKALRSFKAFQILNTQCAEYSRLQSTSSSRYKRKLIREKDFLTIEVLYQTCLLDKKTAENNKAMDELALLKTAGLSLETKIDLSSADFPVQSLTSNGFDVTQNLSFKLASRVLKSAQQKSSSLKSDLLPEVDFSYGLRSEAVGTSIGNSIGEAFGLDQLTHSLGLNLRYDFGDSASKLSAKRALAFQTVKKYELVDLESSLERDCKTLSKSILYLTAGLSRARSLVKLQARKSKLFNRDFSNGRGSIRDLVEAQIAYLSSLERELLFKYNLSDSYVDMKQIRGEDIAKFN